MSILQHQSSDLTCKVDGTYEQYIWQKCLFMVFSGHFHVPLVYNDFYQIMLVAFCSCLEREEIKKPRLELFNEHCCQFGTPHYNISQYLIF